jgi:ABC-2 type transport system ATP-binding protein
MGDVAVSVENVSKMFRLYHDRNQSLKAAVMRRGRARYEEFQALDDVSLEVPSGTTFGLIGENGSGKSTLLKCMARILRPESGTIAVNGKISALLELGAGFHPELSGDPRPWRQGHRPQVRRDRRVRRPGEVHRHAGEELLVGHVRAPGVLGRHQRRP